jgi:hemerythrin-like domain-containing protein
MKLYFKHLPFLLFCLILFIALPAGSQEQNTTVSKPAPASGDHAPEVSPMEDLMREHGLLSRILLIYDTARQRMSAGQSVPADIIPRAADIVRNFVEDYHEKLEEDYIFTRFKKAGVLVELVNTLKQQHDAGRKLTDDIKKYAAATSPGDRQTLERDLAAFNAMYRPHKAREDTVLFPAFHQLVTDKEYGEMGDKFEKRETELFGRDGFSKMVERVAAIEQELDINDLKKFTPQ